ncbi:MAG: type II secretion system protein [Phycisphaerae bacterium]|jgi:type II secretory pathway pseudopilin PulG
MKNKKGFTLVELLVVISIIALLLAVLIPTLRKAKEQANCIVCKSNLRNYGLAGAMYLQANNNAFPHPIICIDGRATFTTAYLSQHPKECRWHDSGVEPQGPFWPYLLAKGVHICPTFSTITRSKRSLHEDYLTSIGADVALCRTLPIRPRLSYSMNGFLSAGDEVENLVAQNGKLQMPKLTDVKHPYATLFMTEENIWTITRTRDGIQVSEHAWNDMYFGTAMYGTRSDSIATFHKASDSKLNKGVSNILFVDGHVDERKAYDNVDLKNRSSSKSYYLATGQQK